MRRMRKNQTAIAAIVGNAIICGAVISGFGDGWVQPVGWLTDISLSVVALIRAGLEDTVDELTREKQSTAAPQSDWVLSD